MTQALAKVEYRPTEIGTQQLGSILVKSGFFKDLKDEAQAIVKILYGKELGFGPMASVLGVYIVEGKPSLSAQLIAAAIQGHPSFKYRVREWTATACRIEFFEDGESLGESSFTIEDAGRAGLSQKQVWKSYPKAMLWARAMSQGARAYCAAIFQGAIYTPEELGAQVDGDGRVVEITEHVGYAVDNGPRAPSLREMDVDDAPRPKPKPRSLEELRDRYAELVTIATEQGIQLDQDHWALAKDAPVEEVRGKGQALKALIDTRTAEAARPQQASAF